ncbi:hypothetical protein EJ110_NYTH00674 [Nymphaea thermarum]|nr:hypothetical protein EJ110_NYTH00674 [Nymphaea thermarum]
MAETKDAHVVVIPTGDEDHLQETLISSAHHPLQEISESPGHLLLLKLWQREEDLFARRITTKETRIDNIRREVFQLCCFFFAFHGFFLTLLFVSSNNFNENSCRKWWVPCFLYLVTSVVMILCVQYKVYRYMKMSARLQKERGDSRTLSRCIQELRMKGASFDLSKEPLSNDLYWRISPVLSCAFGQELALENICPLDCLGPFAPKIGLGVIESTLAGD